MIHRYYFFLKIIEVPEAVSWSIESKLEDFIFC